MTGGRFGAVVIRASGCRLHPRAPRILPRVSPERAFQLVVFSREEIRAFDLPRAGEVTIGRDEASSVRIDDPSVSRQHAVLRVGERLEIEDLGGANGTFVRHTDHAGTS